MRRFNRFGRFLSVGRDHELRLPRLSVPRNATVYVSFNTPARTAVHGMAAGLVGTLLLSILARLLPDMNLGDREGSSRPRTLPSHPHDPNEVRAWQAHQQSPAAFDEPRRELHRRELPASYRASAARGDVQIDALSMPTAPGPEGLAAQFVFKAASGLFNKDISRYMRPAGVAVHLVYGAAWGMGYGLLQAGRRSSPPVFGALYGLGVWAVGPGLLVPAMGLMPQPREQPPRRALTMVAGHIMYGLALSAVFPMLHGRSRR